MPVVRFTHDHRQIIVPVAVVQPEAQGNALVRLRGLIDTGASISGVPASVVADLFLPRRGKAVITTPSGDSIARVHLFRLGLYPDPASTLPHVLESDILGITCSPGDGFDVLIGMDVIGGGDLTVFRDDSGSFDFSE